VPALWADAFATGGFRGSGHCKGAEFRVTSRGSGDEGIEVGKKDDAFLFVRIGARDDGADGGIAVVEGEMGDIGGDVDQVAGGSSP
jgi:hypothetical protein